MERPTLFRLGNRLQACAELVQAGSLLADVGTDHAYLPIWLLRNGIVPRATASDLRPGPLAAAAKNAEKYGVSHLLTLRLSDGLREISPEEADDVVIAGMGGELILRIVLETPWLRQEGKRLVLQPMSSVPELRMGLWEHGFRVCAEQAVLDGGRPYSAFSVCWNEAPAGTPGPLYPYMGKLLPGSPASRQYGEKTIRELRNQAKGASCEGNEEKALALLELAGQIGKTYLEGGETA